MNIKICPHCDGVGGSHRYLGATSPWVCKTCAGRGFIMLPEEEIDAISCEEFEDG